MRWSAYARLSLVAVFCSLACSRVVDTAPLDEGCPADQKLCFGRCVPKHDPAFNCRADKCTACELENAIPRCSADNVCEVEACIEGYGCPSSDGCTVNVLTSADHCGACKNPCAKGEACFDGTCKNSAEGLGGTYL